MKRIIICLLAAALLIPVCAGAEGDTITYQGITVDRNAETVDLGKLRVQNYKEFYAFLEQLPNLKGCQVHTSVMLTDVDIHIFKRLGVDLTSEPVLTKKRF